jgi:uncharacterized protein with HEPN domain
MTRRDDSVSLRQMLDHSREALALVQGRSRGDLDRDRVVTLALCRLVEILGEAANRTSDACRKRHPDIPWRQVIGLRNRLIHGYDSIDLDVLWQILTADLPSLATRLGQIVDPEDASTP